MLGRPRASRAVGYALNALKDSQGHHQGQQVPWWRVINAQGRISTVNREVSASKQAVRLRAEGINVSETFQINLDQYLWEGLSILEIDDIFSADTK